jgi:hypothetical protein
VTTTITRHPPSSHPCLTIASQLIVKQYASYSTGGFALKFNLKIAANQKELRQLSDIKV